ncbi:hypothetical protein P8971_17995 [Serratia marcescens]|uniref:hypothetical protein n=1 Tax=Serratia marcescens TaxID=615 RepID=UPI0032047CB1
MAYDPQQQRPEEQTMNGNREMLIIRQPGKAVPQSTTNDFDWRVERNAREEAGRKSIVPDPNIGIEDLGLCKLPGKTNHSLLEVFRHTDYVL